MLSSSSSLLMLALVVASGTAVPYKMDERSDDFAATLFPNDVEFRIDELKKVSSRRLTEGRTNDEFGDREETGESGEDEAPLVDPVKDELRAKSTKKGRKHKAFFLNYPFVPQLRRYHNSPNYDNVLKNRNDIAGEQKPVHRKRFQQDSQIYYIKLPPTPYMFVPGLGYISQPPTYSTASLQTPHVNHVQRPVRPQNVNNKPTVKPFINVPIDFVSNGKPTGVYQWPGSKRPESSLNSLNEGPYVFNGRPTSLYLLTPDGQQTGHQPIRLADYPSKGRY